MTEIKKNLDEPKIFIPDFKYAGIDNFEERAAEALNFYEECSIDLEDFIGEVIDHMYGASISKAFAKKRLTDPEYAVDELAYRIAKGDIEAAEIDTERCRILLSHLYKAQADLKLYDKNFR